MYVSKDVRICGCVFEAEIVPRGKMLGKYRSRLLFDRCPVCIATRTLDALRLSSFTSELQTNSGRLIR